MKSPLPYLPADIHQRSHSDALKGEALDALRLYIHSTMGRAAAAVLLDRPRSDTTPEEGFTALADIARLPPDDERRQRAARAAWRAVVDNEHLRSLFPAVMCGEISASFSALDSGVTMGVAQPVKNSRPATAHLRDTLARVLAMEVELHKAMLGFDHDSDAVSIVTGAANPDTPNKQPDIGAATLPLGCLTWKQLKDLLKTGRSLVDPVILTVLRDGGFAIAAGLITQDAVLAPEQLQMRRMFADSAWRRDFLSNTFNVAGTGRQKPRAKEATTRRRNVASK